MAQTKGQLEAAEKTIVSTKTFIDDLVEKKDLPALEELMRHHIERSKECCLAALKARKQNRDL